MKWLGMKWLTLTQLVANLANTKLCKITLNKKDVNSVIGVFQEVLIKLYHIPILLYIEGQDDIY